MSNHSAPSRRRGGDKKSYRRRRRKSTKTLSRIGWAFLGAMIVLAAVAVVLLLPEKTPEVEPTPTIDPGPAGSAFTIPVEPVKTAEPGQSGRKVTIRNIACDFTPPTDITFGRLESVDLSALGQTLCDNAAANGWGECAFSVSDNGALTIHAANRVQLKGSEFEHQAAFLQSNQPEQFSRTFLEHSGLIGLLRNYGLTLSTQAENRSGEIIFRGTGTTAGAECSARFTFLYTGAFDQAVIRATYLADAVTTSDVVKLERAISRATAWTAGSSDALTLVSAEVRMVRGLPFYALECDDGTTAFALAVDEKALEVVPGASELYATLMAEGIENNVTVSGGE